MSQITNDDSRPARGRQRQAELAAEMKQAVEINSASMLSGLGRSYTVAEKFVAEAIASLYLRAARLRDAGRSDLEVLREAAKLQQGSVFACRHPAALPVTAIEPATDLN